MSGAKLERVMALAAIPELSELHPDDLASLAERAEPWPDADAPDERDDRIALLLAGSAAAPPQAARREAPAMIGVVEALAGEPFPSLRFEGDAHALVVSGEDLRWVMADVFEVWLAMLRRTVSRLVEADSALGDPARVERDAPLADTATLVGRIQRLSACRLLGGLRAHTLGRLALGLEEVRLDAGALLWEAGRPASEAFLVLEGEFACVSGSGEREPLADAEGMLLGLQRVLGGLDHGFEMVATSDARLLRLSREALIDEFEEDPDAAVTLLEALARGVLEAERAHGSAG